MSGFLVMLAMSCLFANVFCCRCNDRCNEIKSCTLNVTIFLREPAFEILGHVVVGNRVLRGYKEISTDLIWSMVVGNHHLLVFSPCVLVV